MSTNIIAKVLKGIGVVSISIGIFASFFVGGNTESFAITIGVLICSIITCWIIIGFGEIIDLLQQNADNQEEIIRQLKEKTSTVVKNTTTMNDKNL